MTLPQIPTDPHKLGETRKHPAKFSNGFIEIFREMLLQYLQVPWKYETPLVLDPFAGVGTIHQLRPQFATFGVEIETEWADMSQFTYQGDSTSLPDHWTGMFQAICTSPVYGNRMSDHHDAQDSSKRNTYKHVLGHDLAHNNTGMYQFTQSEYRRLHEKVYAECWRVLELGGIFILNVSDHIRKGERMPVAAWHRSVLNSVGFNFLRNQDVQTQRLGFGANSSQRVESEQIMIFRRMTA